MLKKITRQQKLFLPEGRKRHWWGQGVITAAIWWHKCDYPLHNDANSGQEEASLRCLEMQQFLCEIHSEMETRHSHSSTDTEP